MSIQQVGQAWIADTARVVGEVTLGVDTNIWYGVSIRGDVAAIRIGDRTNVQDGVCIHCDAGFENIIGNDVTIGHGAICHGVSIGDGSLIGMGAVLLGKSEIGKGCVVAAGCVVPPNTQVPDGMMIMGVPGKVRREANEQEMHFVKHNAPHYVELAKLHATTPDDLRVRPVT